MYRYLYRGSHGGRATETALTYKWASWADILKYEKVSLARAITDCVATTSTVRKSGKQKQKSFGFGAFREV